MENQEEKKITTELTERETRGLGERRFMRKWQWWAMLSFVFVFACIALLVTSISGDYKKSGEYKLVNGDEVISMEFGSQSLTINGQDWEYIDAKDITGSSLYVMAVIVGVLLGVGGAIGLAFIFTKMDEAGHNLWTEELEKQIK